MKLPPLIQRTGGAGVQVERASLPANLITAARDGRPTREPPGAAVLHQKNSKFETSAKRFFVILSEAKDLVFIGNYEILRSLRSLRMTAGRTFAEVSNLELGTDY